MAYFCNGKKGICTEAYEDCEDCGYFNGTGGHRVQAVTTNADHIRGMTDEELAQTLAAMCKNTVICDYCPLDPISHGSDEWIVWLQQPYKEN